MTKLVYVGLVFLGCAAITFGYQYFVRHMGWEYSTFMSLVYGAVAGGVAYFLERQRSSK